MKSRIALIVLMIAAACAAEAAVIHLKNGDRITGDILTSDEKTVTVKTEFLGDVKVSREAISGIDSEQPLVVTLSDGRKVEGTIATTPQAVVVSPPGAAEVRTDMADLAAVRTEPAQAAYEREQTRLKNPPFFDFWTLNADLGLALTRGNSSTSTLNTNGSLIRATGFDKITLYFSQLYATQSTTEPYGKTANRMSGGVRYDRNISSRTFAFGITEFDHDQFLDLNLRSVFGGGLGVHVLDTERNEFSLGAGFTWNREAFSTGLTRNSGEALFYEASQHKLNGSLSVHQRFQIYPNLTERGQYRMSFEGGTIVKLTRFLNLNTTLVDRYLSNPVADKKSNDVVLTTGIGITFSQN